MLYQLMRLLALILTNSLMANGEPNQNATSDHSSHGDSKTSIGSGAKDAIITVVILMLIFGLAFICCQCREQNSDQGVSELFDQHAERSFSRSPSPIAAAASTSPHVDLSVVTTRRGSESPTPSEQTPQNSSNRASI